MSFKSCDEVKQQMPFEKIIYHTSGCFGKCNVYHLEVNADRQVKLFSERVYAPNGKTMIDLDSTKMGYFTGTLSDEDFKSLCIEFKQVNMDSLSFPNVLCCDGPVTTLISYYNGKKKSLKSMTPSEKATPLLKALNYICQQNNFKKTDQRFEIEKIEEK